MDQGVHNYLVHNRLVPGVRLIPNEAGPVLTMGYMREVTRSDLEDRHVLHQYDRHPAIAAELRRRWPPDG